MFLKVHPELLGAPEVLTWEQRFQKCFDYWEDIDNGGFEDWFREDAHLFSSWHDDAEYMQDLIEEMLGEGIVFWNHPGWYSSLWLTFKWWYDEGEWLKLRMYAEWLLSVAPGSPTDDHFFDKLRRIAATEFDLLENENYDLL